MTTSNRLTTGKPVFEDQFSCSPKPEPLAEPAQGEPPQRHKWDRAGERCEICGAKDWMDASCVAPSQPKPPVCTCGQGTGRTHGCECPCWELQPSMETDKAGDTKECCHGRGDDCYRCKRHVADPCRKSMLNQITGFACVFHQDHGGACVFQGNAYFHLGSQSISAEPLAEPKLTLREKIDANCKATGDWQGRTPEGLELRRAEPKLEELPDLELEPNNHNPEVCDCDLVGLQDECDIQPPFKPYAQRVIECRERQLLLKTREASLLETSRDNWKNIAHDWEQSRGKERAELVSLRGEREHLKDVVRVLNRSWELVKEVSEEQRARAEAAEAQLAGTWFAHKEHIAAEVRNHCDETPDEIASFICFMKPPTTPKEPQ